MIRWQASVGASLLVCGVAAAGALYARTSIGTAPAQGSARAGAPPLQPRTVAGPSGLPLLFEPNVGQLDSAVRFMARRPGYQLQLTAAGATWHLQRPSSRTDVRSLADRADEPSTSVSVVSMRLVGARTEAQASGVARQTARAHYYGGQDRREWRANVPTFARVHYTQIYPGVDLEYYGRDGALEYDFVLAAGVDPGVIGVAFDGARRTSLDPTGQLVVEAGEGRLVQAPPVAYQVVDGRRVPIDSRYEVRKSGEVGFVLGAYDRTLPLVIDPVISYSTYLGGTGGPYGEQAYGIAVDPADNIYVTGKTASAIFPVQGGQAVNNDVFVLKMSPAGEIAYLVVLGGAASDSGEGIAVDAGGQVVVTGFTDSANLPTLNPIHGDRPGRDAFVFKLDANGGLVYSTYLGGSDTFDYGEAVVLDAQGTAYVTGSTKSADFPVLNALDPGLSGQDAFVAKIDAAGALVYSTFLGGTGLEAAESIALDPDGSFYVTGWTTSSNFPRAVFTGTKNSGEDVFISRFAPDGSSFVYSRFLGGNSHERPFAITPDGQGGVYLGGRTDSTNFPVLLPLQVDQPGTDIFLTRLDSAGQVSFSTYLGGNDWERILGLAVREGRLYVTGQTFSTNFPVMSAVQPAKAGGVTTGDAFVTTIEVGTSQMLSSTYLGGIGHDEGRGVGPLAGGNVFVAGWTEATDFPVVRPVQGTLSNVGNAFLTRIAPVGVTSVAPDFIFTTGGQSITVTGQDFVAGATLTIGGVAATGVQVVNGTQLTATAPAIAAAGAADVVVTIPGLGSGTLYDGVMVLSGTGPIADAGPNQAVEATGLSTSIVLNGTGSFDPDQEPLTYEWRDAANTVIATTAMATVSLPIGVHQVSLTVSDGHSTPSSDAVTITITDNTAPAVSVVSPDGVNKIYTLTPAVIEWTASDAASGLASFDVYLSSDGGATWGATPICAGVPAASRTCTWAAPSPATTKARVRVVARDASGNSAADASNANFSIVAGSAFVTVTAPNTSVNWGAGSTQQIKWSHNLSTSGYTRLELSLDGGSNWSLIAAAVKNTAGGSGVYNWTVPATLSSTARIRASWVHGPASDTSNVNFTIAAPFVSLTQPPSAGTNWGYGTRRTQKWTSNLGPTDRVSVVLLTGQPGNPSVVMAADVLASAKTATFVAPTLASPTATAQVQVVWVNPPPGFSAAAASPVGLRVETPFVTVNGPNGGQTWTAGTNQTVTWSHNLGTLENVTIEISTDDGATYPFVGLASTPSDGSQSVAVQSSWISTLARVRVSWLTSPSIADVSNASFVIR